MQYSFEWDPAKASRNTAKHGVSFEQAIDVFKDPMALTLYENEESTAKEERWVTIGLISKQKHLLVVHTYLEQGNNMVSIRVISARPATKREIKQYKQKSVNSMRKEYDFSKAERGKFYKPDAQYNLPLYLDAEVLDYFSLKAKAKGIELNALVNDLLKKDIELIEGMK